ncbi:MAG: hypothetical protein KAH07_01280 [Flavobacteriaceae bacterium]|nr:hypothetical protein [Flavobacteriaceae bacterium]
MKLKNLIIFLSASLVLFSCHSKDSSCDVIYFGGQIINPHKNFITLSKNDIVTDTIYLDESNSFLTELESDKGGLYSFNYGNEYQYVYFEPMDSILIRLNTWDFDESIVFSGRGAERNNFLINLYLQNEKEDYEFSPNYNLECSEFESKIDTSLARNLNLYEKLEESGIELSERFEELAKVAMNYTLYSKKEFYPMVYKNRKQLEELPELSDTFFDYRKDIDLNNKDLISYSPYNRYISSYIQATAYKNKNSNYTLETMHIISENIQIEELKNKLLFQAFYSGFRKSNTSCSINKKSLLYFNKHCTSKKLLNRVKMLVKDCDNINSVIDNFDLVSLSQHKTKINNVIKNKNTVIYFWSPTIISPDMLVKKINYLKDKYPDLLFVGINLDSSKHSNQINKQLDHQFILSKNSGAYNYVNSQEPRTILIDKNGVVLNSFTYLSSNHLEKQLSELEKR